MHLHIEALFVCDLAASYLWVYTTMGDADHKPPGNCNRHEKAGDSHPQSASSTLRTRLHAQVCGVGTFPTHTEVAHTIASLRNMCGIKPHERAIATNAANTGGVSMVWSYSCGHVATSI